MTTPKSEPNEPKPAPEHAQRPTTQEPTPVRPGEERIDRRKAHEDWKKSGAV